MAEENKKPDDKEMKVPVFSVLKNGTVKKNIFLDNPQWVCPDDDDEEEDSPILIGRHPDCHIVLDHPSISRRILVGMARKPIQKGHESSFFSVTVDRRVHGQVQLVDSRPELVGDFAIGTEELGTGASSSVAFSTYGSLTGIISPTAEDHILDCALTFKRIKGDEQLVVLSNSITLKIKAMAEGLLCETPKEFRASLLDPYSNRFLWSDSSPRGSSWSYVDEVDKIEDYYNQFPAVRRMPKPIDSVKGLKLILLHKYHYGKTDLVKSLSFKELCELS